MPNAGSDRPTSRSRAALVALVCAAGLSSPAQAQNNRDKVTIVQWFENRWADIEHRSPDFFMAGYNAIWFPPISRCRGSTSVGYDPLDRFDLGRKNSPTAYGTESGWHAARDELQNANASIFVDIIMNHNGGRDGSVGFQEQGGWPGFWMNSDDPPTQKGPADDWGDFHDGSTQSENPNGPNYDLFNGDLVALVDIAQESNFQFIRQPVEEGNPDNIPAGTVYNRVDPNNIVFYPDRDLPEQIVNNPGANGNGPISLSFYPFNTADPTQGDATTENGTGLLLRWTQWMLEVQKVDGFRLDAAKHIPSWFWDQFWDSVVYQREQTPDGRLVTPFSFVEAVAGNNFVYNNYVRKNDGFGNRDALDLVGSGALRDLNNAGGFGSWLDVLDAHIDNEDGGLNNGQTGVNHVFSHDNGTVGNGGSLPQIPLKRWQAFTQHAYVLLRRGPAIVYHNARGINRASGFFPREGIPLAFGLDPDVNDDGTAGGAADSALDDRITKLIEIRNELAFGAFNVINGSDPVNQSFDDVLIFERWSPTFSGSTAQLLVGVNDRYDPGLDTRNVQTSFIPGTRLHELTGNAANPSVDPGNVIPEVLVVDPTGRVTLTVPRNNAAGTEHHRGYVAYGPALPSGTLTVTPTTSVIPADPPTTPASRRRLTEIPVVTDDVFTIRLETTQSDPMDPATDQEAVFRIDEGFFDYNNNGGEDYPWFDQWYPGFENFVTTNQPLFSTGVGLYEQVIDATDLEEGYHYLLVRATRQHAFDQPKLSNEFRMVFCVDRECAQVELVGADEPYTGPNLTFVINALDRTAERVHFLLDLPPGADPIAEATIFNRALSVDRFEFNFNVVGLADGEHTVDLVIVEETGRTCVQSYTIQVGEPVEGCFADVTTTGTGQGDPGFGVPDGEIDLADLLYFVNIWDADLGNTPGSDADLTTTGTSQGDPGFGQPDGMVDLTDLLYYVNAWSSECQ